MLFQKAVVDICPVVEFHCSAVPVPSFQANLIQYRSFFRGNVPDAFDICVACDGRNIVVKAVFPVDLNFADVVGHS